MRSLILCLSLIVGLTYCTNSKPRDAHNLLTERLLTKNHVTLTKSPIKVVVVSDGGCKSCKRKMLELLAFRQPVQNLLVIFSGLSLDDSLSLKVRKLYNDSFIDDPENLIGLLDIDLFGTGTFLIDRDSIRRVKTFVPDEQGFNELNQFLVLP